MRRIIRYVTNIFYKPLLVKWLSKERNYTWQDITLRIHPQVFHPRFFFSTRILTRYLDELPLQGKRFLEIGAGSGLISFAACRAGADVTASDINPIATAYLVKNREANQLPVSVIESDLFKQIPTQLFDFIAINPPYYFKTPVSWQEYAWYCGENGEFFHDLFAGLGNYINRDSVVFMILCEGCNREQIKQIANNAGFELECVKTVRNLIEKNFVYQVHPQ